MKIFFFLFISLFTLSSILNANTYTAQTDSIIATRTNEKIKVDGILSESIWKNGNGISKFTQRDPKEGALPSHRTIVHVLYDDDAIYVGSRMYDASPDSIIARLGRRDSDMDSDRFIVFLDPYLDRRSGFYFVLNAAGTYSDGVMTNDDWDDSSWDGVWEGEVKIDEEGWTAEMRIPYSQLRFHKKDRYKWGVNFRRDIARYNEYDYLVFTPKDGSGFVSRFPLLIGIENIKPARGVEVLPYFRTKAEYLDVDAKDPFNDGSRYLPGMGADLKFGIGSNLTLDGTINPDFGQVEVDPAVVNLSDVETYFNEKRPFFIEGASIFNSFGYGGSRSNWSFNFGNPDFFYSRRIGGAPQGGLPSYDYADVPDGTRIFGASKLTGKLGDSWNVGTIHAVTNREYADLSDSTGKFESEVEPLTYYGLMRAQKEFDQGRQGLGFISTFTSRNFKDDRLRSDINSNAFTGGIDGWTFLDQDKEWVVTGWLGMSHIRGSEERITSIQQNSRHYFQRPDANHVEVDTMATSLTGYAGRITINKQKGNWILNSALGFIDPKFDVNDVGFMSRGDVINSHIGGGYKWTEVTKFTRLAEVIGSLFGSLDFDNNVTWAGVWSNAYLQFLNYYSVSLSVAYNLETISNRRTRGGPLTKNLSGWEFNFSFETDSRKPWVFEVGTSSYHVNSNYWNRRISLEVEYKPQDNISIEFNPSIMWDKEFAQWAGEDPIADPLATKTFGKRYIFAEMNYTEFEAGIRVNWTFTPKLSFQLYMQPLFSVGKYNNFKELAAAKTLDFNKYGDGNSTIEKNGDEYIVDPDGTGPAGEFTFNNPDFNDTSIRANAVLRWEYMPGSTLYLVWTQSKWHEETDGRFKFRDSVKNLWHANQDNIIMLKLNYWLNI